MSASEKADAQRRWAGQRLAQAVAVRLSGPGGCYIAGNVLGLGMAMFMQIRLALTEASSTFAAPLIFGHDLAGGWNSLALLVASAIFLRSGEEYHRALSNGHLDPSAIQRADFLSGTGSLVLGSSLLLVGNPILVVTSGLLHAVGKFGSAFRLGAHGVVLFGLKVPELFRLSVLLSRFPAIIVTATEVARVIADARTDQIQALAMPATLLVCYLLWARGDILLFGK